MQPYRERQHSRRAGTPDKAHGTGAWDDLRFRRIDAGNNPAAQDYSLIATRIIMKASSKGSDKTYTLQVSKLVQNTVPGTIVSQDGRK